MNYADYIIAGVLIISGAHGWYIGFILSFFNVAGYILAGVAAKLYYQTAALWIAKYTQMDERMTAFINEQIMEQLKGLNPANMALDSESAVNVPSDIQEQLMEAWPNALKSPVNESIQNMTSHTVDLIMNFIGLIAVFILVLLSIKILVAVLNAIAKVPGLKEINRGGGLILGLLKGVLVVLVILAILTPFIGTNPDHVVTQTLFESRMGSWVYKNNILIWWIRDYLLTRLQLI